MIDIKGLDKAEVLRHLYNAALPSGLSTFAGTPEVLSPLEAEQYVKIAASGYFSFIHGRGLHVDIGKDKLDTRAYDAANGEGAAAAALAPLTAEKQA